MIQGISKPASLSKNRSCSWCGSSEDFKNTMKCSSCGTIRHIYCVQPMILSPKKLWKCSHCRRTEQSILQQKNKKEITIINERESSNELRHNFSAQVVKKRKTSYRSNIKPDFDPNLQTAILNSVAFERRVDFKEINHVPILRPTETEFSNPTEYINSLHEIGIQYGALCIVPPKSWNKERKINLKSFRFKTRVQRIHSLQEGLGWPFGKICTLEQYKDMATKFQKEKGFHLASLGDIEKAYWDIVNGKSGEVSVFYGNDIDTSTFCNKRDRGISPWKLSKLPKSAASPISRLDIKGITIPWAYVGMLFSSFCWHCEDNHLPSVSYLHEGAPKVWYCVGSKQAQTVEKVMKQNLAGLFEGQVDLMNNLCTALDPTILIANGVKVHKVIQQRGSLVVTFPRGYHCGFNSGFNVAEAVNLSYEKWFPFGRNCVNEYKLFRRKSQFSHEKLLAEWIRAGNTGIETRFEAKKYIKDYEQQMQELRKAGFRTQMLCQNAAEVQCHLCNYTCYFGYIACGCVPGGKVVSCFEHFSAVRCGRCEVGEWVMHLSPHYINFKRNALSADDRRISPVQKWSISSHDNEMENDDDDELTDATEVQPMRVARRRRLGRKRNKRFVLDL